MKEIVTFYQVEYAYSPFFSMRHLIIGGRIKEIRGYYENLHHYDFVVVSDYDDSFSNRIALVDVFKTINDANESINTTVKKSIQDLRHTLELAEKYIVNQADYSI